MSVSQNFDVIVVGGGVIGLAIARALRLKGVRRIAVLERACIGRESSWAAAGMLSPGAESTVPDDFHRLCVESAGMYPDFASALLAETGIDIELDRTGTLYLSFTGEDSKELQKRSVSQGRAGIAVELLPPAEILKREPQISTDVREGLFYPNDSQVENRKLLRALRQYCEANGLGILENTRVEKLLTEKGRISGIVAGVRRFTADQVVLAAGAWTNFISIEGAQMSIAVKPIRGQMISYAPAAPLLRHTVYSFRGYLVPRADGRLLAGATVEDVGFNSGVTIEGATALGNAAEEILPGLRKIGIVDHWAGLRPFVPPDGLPVIGPFPNPVGLTIAAGHYRNGILLAPVTAEIIASYIVNGAPSEYFRLFGPGRFSRTVGNVQT